jgi:predicted nucleotidyltransferase
MVTVLRISAFSNAYLFGSVCRPGHFHDRSNVDIAVTSIHLERYFMAISLLSAWLESNDYISVSSQPRH